MPPVRQCFLALLLSGAAANASSSVQTPAVDDTVPLDDYLAALAQIAPAARDGAEAYLAAYRQRCRRALSVRALRRQVAEGDGDPVLMGMLRAAALHDEASLRSLAASIRCDGQA